jgi:hypothetical protein
MMEWCDVGFFPAYSSPPRPSLIDRFLIHCIKSKLTNELMVFSVFRMVRSRVVRSGCGVRPEDGLSGLIGLCSWGFLKGLLAGDVRVGRMWRECLDLTMKWLDLSRYIRRSRTGIYVEESGNGLCPLVALLVWTSEDFQAL